MFMEITAYIFATFLNDVSRSQCLALFLVAVVASGTIPVVARTKLAHYDSVIASAWYAPYICGHLRFSYRIHFCSYMFDSAIL